jgi:hypothetical protein
MIYYVCRDGMKKIQQKRPVMVTLPSAMVTTLSKVGKPKPFSASFPALPSVEALALGKDFF